MSLTVFTIGGYGFDEESFFARLVNSHVELFVDVRQRRGLRGPRYAFLNSRRLQVGLAARGIAYLHARELAPSTEVRSIQRSSDEDVQVSKRDRTQLSDAFVSAYKAKVLEHFQVADFIDSLGGSQRVALFCVEQRPEACHRSIVADYLATHASATVEHLCP